MYNIFWVIDQNCPFQHSPNLWYSDKNDDVLNNEYDVNNEKYLCAELINAHSLSINYHIKNIHQNVSIRNFLFYL